MMNTKAKLTQLRETMNKEGIDAFVIYSADPHMSEYLPDMWKERAWLSGFTGSAGLVVVTKDKAGLWTDSRYFVQAATELQDSGIALFKQGMDGVPDYISWISSELSDSQTVGINGICCAHDDWEAVKTQLATQNISLMDCNLLAGVWQNRPKLSSDKIFIHPEKYAGEDVISKLEKVRSEMEATQTTLHVVSSLDDIAWILNLRGSDVDYNPVFLSYLLISDKKATLYISEEKCNSQVAEHLAKAKISIAKYEDFFTDLLKIRNEKILIAAHSNQRIFENLMANNTFVQKAPPSQLLKSIKNSVEIAGMQCALKKDGVAMVQFLYWLKKNVGNIPMDEVSVAEKLFEIRSHQADFKGASFGTIAGYNENGAIVHYSAKKKSCKKITKEGVLLLDSGAQFLHGTTDITRTIPLGTASDDFKKDYTLVLKAMIALNLSKFPKGTRGCNVDAIGRQHLWQHGCNYGHGTGHGIGCFLNVHEGPQSIRQELKDQALLPGMISSNEPGLYKEGRYGIRHENLVLCVEKETTEFGTFYGFETLTLCPFFTDVIVSKLLSSEEKKWINNYHKKVYETLSPMLDKATAAWLGEQCTTIE